MISLEVGKYYVARNGRIAKVTNTQESCLRGHPTIADGTPVLAYKVEFDGTEPYDIYWVHEDGWQEHHLKFGGRQQHPQDLISEVA